VPSDGAPGGPRPGDAGLGAGPGGARPGSPGLGAGPGDPRPGDPGLGAALGALGGLRSVVEQLWRDSDVPLSVLRQARSDLACLERSVCAVLRSGLPAPGPPPGPCGDRHGGWDVPRRCGCP